MNVCVGGGLIEEGWNVEKKKKKKEREKGQCQWTTRTGVLNRHNT